VSEVDRAGGPPHLVREGGPVALPAPPPSPRRGPVRLAEVAEQAGVSLATASRVLNGSHRSVGEPHRGRVLAAAGELGYRANAHAQAIARGASNVVGLVVHDISDPYFSAIADGVMRQCEQRGLVVVMASTRRDPERELDYVATLRAQRARAMIIVGSRTRDKELTARLAAEIAGFAEAGGQVACISQNRLGTHTVLVQNRAGARELARELAALGHRRVAVLAGPPELLTARDRHAGFVEGLRESGVPDAGIATITGPFTRDGGYAAATELVTDGLGVTCVFAVNDVMAVGAMAAFRDHGLSVPDDVSVAGFDDIRTLRDLVPPLTTVGLPLEEMGERAAALALDTEPGEKARTVRVRGEVVLRASTRPVD
jgi:LacI family transcriptional regulator, galactose operon repressor